MHIAADEAIGDLVNGAVEADDLEPMDVNGNMTENNNLDVDSMNKNVQTDLTLEGLAQQLSEKMILEKKVILMSFDKEAFIDNDPKTRYFTGLPNSKMLFELYEILAPDLYNTRYKKTTKLSPFQQLMITFMKLKMNLDYTYLAYK